MVLVGHVARMVEVIVAYKVVVGKPDEKRPFRRPRYRWEDNIKMDLQEEERVHGRNCLPQDSEMWWLLVIAVMNFQVP
jgi:hypothetical protein